MPYARVVALVGAAAALAACSVRDDAANTSDTSTTTATTETTGVTRQEIAAPTPTPSPTPMIAAAIQTQPGPKGAQVALNKASVTGDVLNVQLTYLGSTDISGSSWVKLSDISVIDDATSQRIGVLKDNAGKYLAAPLNSDGDELRIQYGKNPAIVWMKFPAPPATTATVSINIPEVAPFDAVAVTR